MQHNREKNVTNNTTNNKFKYNKKNSPTLTQIKRTVYLRLPLSFYA